MIDNISILLSSINTVFFRVLVSLFRSFQFYLVLLIPADLKASEVANINFNST